MKGLSWGKRSPRRGGSDRGKERGEREDRELSLELLEQGGRRAAEAEHPRDHAVSRTSGRLGLLTRREERWLLSQMLEEDQSEQDLRPEHLGGHQ